MCRAEAFVELLPIVGCCGRALRRRFVERVVRRIVLHFRCADVCLRHCAECRNVGLPFGVELYRRHIVEHTHGVAHGCCENLPHRLLVLEFNLGLRGVDVHVDVRRVDCEVYKIRYLFAFGHESFVGGHDGFVEVGVLHVASVDEEELACALLSCRLGLAYESAYLAHRGVDVYRQQVLVYFLSNYFDDALAQSASLQVVKLGLVVVEREGNVGVDECDALECGDDIVEFGGVRLEELAAYGDVVEEVADGEVATYGALHGFLRHEARTGDGECRAEVVVGSACAQFHLSYGGDRSERLTAEAHRVQIEEVVGLAYLRRGVTFERQACVGLRHALAVVGHLYRRAAGVDAYNVDECGAGVDGVLHQLLYHACGALYHLACGYLVCH